MGILLLFVYALVFIFGLSTICIVISGYLENKEGELWIERYIDYFENKGKELADRKKTGGLKNEHDNTYSHRHDRDFSYRLYVDWCLERYS